ncbi:hypothetical protein M878_45515 [Streptomyces roseochromogenus subsp. oscitans DS 12.976]|uniref:Uncharacterized protein n=1 Tax=Streptomyces roseochromogenus subsp. oscitans DS 12.976 TaxID=1352936 RepID=V6JEK1_STRRC|nr:hypothetical protein M878_45515 [Streptomyces roseochromogenus subsp. oscitans DS 12.976]
MGLGAQDGVRSKADGYAQIAAGSGSGRLG